MLAIIPARGGSKGLPRKNIKMLGNKPLIFWTIEAALKAKSISKVILSTEDKEIADVCSQTDIEIPFMRPNSLAGDNSSAIDVYIYTINKLKKENIYNQDEYVVLLPTVPFVSAKDIDNAINLFKKNDADSVISTTKLDFPKEWIFDIENDSKLIGKVNYDISSKNRQDYKYSFIPNGGIYVLKHSLVSKERTYYFKKTLSYEMPQERSVDIDTEFNFKFAEFLYKEDYV